MSTIRNYEDLEAWKKARVLVREVYRHTRSPYVRNDRGYCAQLQRAAMSTMSNIAEGFGRQSDREFAQFLNLSKGSASEVSSMLYAGVDVGYLSPEEFDAMQGLCKETIRLTGKLQGYLRQSAKHARPH